MRVTCAALFVAAVAPEAAAFAPGGAFAPGLAARPIGRVSSVRPFAAVGGARRATRVLDLKATAAIQPDQKVFFPAPARRHMSRVRIRWMRCHTAPPRPNIHRQFLKHLATPQEPQELAEWRKNLDLKGWAEEVCCPLLHKLKRSRARALARHATRQRARLGWTSQLLENESCR
jgi:hypothetical protein